MVDLVGNIIRRLRKMKNNETIKNSAMLGGDGVKGFNTLRVFEAFA